MNRSSLAPSLMLATSVSFWAGSYRANAVAGEHTPAFVLGALRTGLAAVCLLALVPLLRSRLPRGRVALWSAITGLLMVSLFFTGHAEGTVRAGPAITSVLTNTSPFFVLFLARVFLGERVRRLAVVGLVGGFAGVVLMVSSQIGGGRSGTDLAIGYGLALAGSFGWAAGTLVVRRLAVRDPQLDVLGLQAAQYAIGGAVLLALAFAIDGSGSTDWGAPGLWEGLLWVSVGSSVIGVLAFFGALKRIPAVRASAVQFLVPVGAIVVELVAGHPPSALELVGMATAIVGVVLVNVPAEQFARLGTWVATRRVGRADETDARPRRAS